MKSLIPPVPRVMSTPNPNTDLINKIASADPEAVARLLNESISYVKTLQEHTAEFAADDDWTPEFMLTDDEIAAFADA